MKRIVCSAFAAFCAAALFADVETVTSDAATFNVYATDGGAYVLTGAADFAAWPVTWRAGDTVTATAMDGTAYTLAEGAASASSAALPSKGGVWTLTSALSGTAEIGVPWTVFDDGGDLATTGAAASATVETEQTGPNRKLNKREAPPVAYSGDDWAGDLTKAATVTFTPPAGSGLLETTWNRTGDGAEAFAFAAKGVWTVTLTFADATTRTAQIDIVSEGFVITFR